MGKKLMELLCTIGKAFEMEKLVLTVLKGYISDSLRVLINAFCQQIRKQRRSTEHAGV
jgi:hypothetical protein